MLGAEHVGDALMPDAVNCTDLFVRMLDGHTPHDGRGRLVHAWA